MQQTGDQEPSPIPGKMMNCGDFGTFEPSTSTSISKALCHGGRYFGDVYLPCPVRAECRNAAIEQKNKRLPVVNSAPAAPEPERRFTNPFAGQMLRMPDYRTQPTQLPQARAVDQAKAAATAAVDAAAAAVAAQAPQVVVPPVDNPPGMRTPFAAAMNFIGEMSPTFLPQENEDIFERLFKNIVQGMISAIGWQLYNLARVADLFGSRGPRL
jgi:hypothetical protein